MAKLPNIIEKERSVWQVIRFVFAESLRGSKKYSIMRYVSTGAVAVFTFAEIGSIAIIVNEFATHGISEARIPILIKGFLIMVVSNFAPTLLSGISKYATSIQGSDLGRYLQARFIDAVHKLDIGTIEQPEFQNIVEIATTRGWNHFHTIIFHINTMVRDLVAVIVSAVSLIAISPIILGIVAIGAIPGYFIERKNGIILNNLYRRTAERARAWRIKTGFLGNKHELIELKNFNLVQVFKKKFLRLIEVFHEDERKILKKYRLNDIYGEIIITIAFGISFFLLIRDVYLGLLAIGTLVFSFSAIVRFQFAIQSLFDSLGKISEYKKNVSILMDLIEMKPLLVSGKRLVDLSIPLVLELKKVSFTYPGGDRPVLHDISLTITQGENLAIVGLNGAGKTTLLKILTRVYDPTSGEILVNGIPLHEYDLKDWRKNLAILFQEYSLYSEETIAENIMLGDISKHDQELVKQSATETTADEFIEALPDKYKQKVGTEFRGGVELSKGQKQKLALARVFYRQAPIVILDEPTAAIDAVSEDRIFDAIKAKHSNQTRIVISHKFSNVRDSDQIILIKNGRIIERGTHDELINFKGQYAELFQLQAKGYQ